MAALLPQRGARLGARRRSAYRPLAEINVTPFVDVMLVLLIVFMVTAPLLTQGIPLNLPQTRAQNITQPDEPLVISVTRDGLVFLQGETRRNVPAANLVPLLVEVTRANPDVAIFVKGDRDVPYGRFAEVMGAITVAGFRKVSLVTEMPAAAAP